MGKFEVFCERYLSQFTYTQGDPKSVGLEKEILVTDQAGYMADISKSIWPHLLKKGFQPVYDTYYKDKVVGFWDGDDQIALDAGLGTLEIIMKPYGSIQKAERRMKEILKIVLPICREEKLRLLGLAYQPRTGPARENWNKKQRYDVLVGHLGPPVYSASLSASDQVHVDIPKQEIVPVVNVMNGFAAFFVTLFANCPVYEGPNEYKAIREIIWDELGRDRTGLPLTSISSIEDYLERTWEMDCILARQGDKFFAPKIKFKDYVTDFDDDETFEAYKIHEGTIWFCARPRTYGTVEMRPAGLQPWDNMAAVAALSLGILENLEESEMFLKDFRWDTLRELRFEAVKKGFEVEFQGKPIAEYVKEVLNLGRTGLIKRGNGEEVYLDPLFERAKNRKAPVDIGREYLKQGGMEMLLDKSTLREEYLKL